MSLPLGIFSDRPLRLRIDRFPDQICQWEYIWSYFHLAEFIGTGGGDIQSLGHQTSVLILELLVDAILLGNLWRSVNEVRN